MDGRILMITVRSALRAIADLAMPRVCLVCGKKLLLRENHICTECEADMPLTRFPDQRSNPMALAFNGITQREIQSEDAPFEPFSYAAALIFYSGDSGYKNIPQGLKYHRNFGEGRHFARMLGGQMAASAIFQDVSLALPVPLHWARRWQRGYNQAEVVARGIAEELPSARVDTRVLRRVHRTKTQTKLHKSQRYANVRSAFVADASKVPKGARHLLLVDDVYTTGATLCACERALRASLRNVLGEESSQIRISVATLAYVGR